MDPIDLTEQDIAELLAALDVVVRTQGLSAVPTVARLQVKLTALLKPPAQFARRRPCAPPSFLSSQLPPLDGHRHILPRSY